MRCSCGVGTPPPSSPDHKRKCSEISCPICSSFKKTSLWLLSTPWKASPLTNNNDSNPELFPAPVFP